MREHQTQQIILGSDYGATPLKAGSKPHQPYVLIGRPGMITDVIKLPVEPDEASALAAAKSAENSLH